MHQRLASWAICLNFLTGTPSCKVPIFDIGATFTLMDGTWFESEQTLFIFYEVSALQGLGETSVIDISYRSDDGLFDWTPLTQVPLVHSHLPIDCGLQTLCGSASLRVSKEPRDFGLRLRYHQEGELALQSVPNLNIVRAGEAHSQRSLIVYGVFDETNRYVQWRGRHQFPTIRNEQAQKLGLRRHIKIENQIYSDSFVDFQNNPYGYDLPCPAEGSATGFGLVEGEERAMFNLEPLPTDAFESSIVCAQATVKDATGNFKSSAMARKNPETRPAFPVLRSPVGELTPIRYFLAPCNTEISTPHKTMQQQRLLFTEDSPYCTDASSSTSFVSTFVTSVQQKVSSLRQDGKDMVLVIGLHRDESAVAQALEEALVQIMESERSRSTPRLVGAFVFDSSKRTLQEQSLKSSVLWCPAYSPLEDSVDSDTTSTSTSDEQDDDASDLLQEFGMGLDASSRTCPIALDNLNLDLGPLSIGTLPILPTRQGYLDFIDSYSESQAGEVTSIGFYAPEFTPTTELIELGGLAVGSFLNNELFNADPNDAFSYCPDELSVFFIFRSNEILAQGLPAAPLAFLPQWHNLNPEDTYDIGIVWDFPFLLRMQYQAVLGFGLSAFGLSVPFSIANDTESFLGSSMWTNEEFSLAESLTQCTRFCEHPTFDSAGIYNVLQPFRSTYANTCFSPVYPALGDSGFPHDP
jgi:hypothetical protein